MLPDRTPENLDQQCEAFKGWTKEKAERLLLAGRKICDDDLDLANHLASTLVQIVPFEEYSKVLINAVEIAVRKQRRINDN